MVKIIKILIRCILFICWCICIIPYTILVSGMTFLIIGCVWATDSCDSFWVTYRREWKEYMELFSSSRVWKRETNDLES